MKFLFISVMLTAAAILTSCVNRPFQPAPSDFQRWKREGTSKDEVKRTMSMCGFLDHFNNGKMTAEGYAKAQNCMLKEGFSHDYERGVLCDQKEYQKLNACNANDLTRRSTTVR